MAPTAGCSKRMSSTSILMLPLEIQEGILGMVDESWHCILVHVSRLWHSIIVGYRQRRNLRPCPLLHVSTITQSTELYMWASAQWGLPRKLVCSAAAGNGQLQVLIAAVLQGYPVDVRTGDAAAYEGHIHIIDYLWQMAPTSIANIQVAAVRRNQMSVLLWAKAHHWGLADQLCTEAASFGHLEMLQYLLNQGCTMQPTVCAAAAAKAGHLDMLQWLVVEHSCPLQARLCANAAFGGHLKVLQWLREQGCPWDAWVARQAAFEGHQPVLRWAIANNAPLNEQVCAMAAYRGHMEILQWARAQGCPWDSSVVTLAAAGGYDEIVMWAAEAGCPWDEAALFGAENRDNSKLLMWAWRTGRVDQQLALSLGLDIVEHRAGMVAFL